MKQKFYLLVLLGLVIICGCSKEKATSNQDILGDWVWKTSRSSNNVQMLSTDSVRSFSIQFEGNNKFTNSASCIIGGPTDGNYQIKNVDGSRVLILNCPNYEPDTLTLSLAVSTLTLAETSNGYTWYHYFDKK